MVVKALLTVCSISWFILGTAEAADDLPFRISEATTHVTQPKTPEGFVDLAGAINTQLSDGVSREDNAAAVLFYWLGPEPEGTRLDPRFYQELGIPVPEDDGHYFDSLGDFLDSRGIKHGSAKRDAVFEDQGDAQTRPWPSDEFPEIAAWLNDQSVPLEQIVTGLQRDRYFAPIIPAAPEAAGQGLIATLLPQIQLTRGLSRALLCRAMLHLGNHENGKAWQNIVWTLRLGRHVGHGASLIDRLVGVAIVQQAHQAAITFLNTTAPDQQWVQQAHQDLQALPKRADVADAVTLFERLAFVDIVTMLNVDLDDREELLAIEDGLLELSRIIELPWVEDIDWNETLQVGNVMFDGVSAAMRLPAYSERVAAFKEIHHDIGEMKKQVTGLGQLQKALLESDHLEKVMGRAVGQILVVLLVPAITKADDAQSRAEQTFLNVQTALALAAYHAEHRNFPETLTSLQIRNGDEVPSDIFSGQPLIYSRTNDGYRLYSVGVNQTDDQGRSYEQGGDDLVVTIELAD